MAIYLAQKSVGLFVRGPRRSDPGDVRDQLAPHQAELERALDAPIREGGAHGHFFWKERRGDMRNEQLWPEMASWLHETQNAYVEALSQQLGPEEMS